MGPEACGYGPAEEVVGAYIRTARAQPLVFTKLCCVGGEMTSMTSAYVRCVRASRDDITLWPHVIA